VYTLAPIVPTARRPFWWAILQRGPLGSGSAAKIGSATSAYATGNDRLFVVDNGTQTAIFRFHSSGANAAVSASELTLVALVSYDVGTTSTTLGDYTFAP
jgi:hypothetical protein